MISFDNTAVAFASKNDRELKRAYRLFKLIGNNTLMKIGKCLTVVSLKFHLPIKGLIRRTIFAQFCGGETIEQCRATIDKLGKYGVGTILDYSVEGMKSEEDFERNTQQIIASILYGENDPNIPFSVFKPTGVARFSLLEKANTSVDMLSNKEKEEYQRTVDRFDRICKTGFEKNIPVFIDAEESWIQNAIDRIVYQMMLHYNTKKAMVYNTVQMYRLDRLDFLKRSVALAKKDGIHYGVKVVRGAYMEKERQRAHEQGYPSPIHHNKDRCDKDHDAALSFLISELDHVAICAGTHNEKSSLWLATMLEQHAIPPSDQRIYFSQLLGMGDHISYNLANHGFNVVKYVPYGSIREVMPYLLRRAEENTSIAGQTSRELTLIQTERQRRKQTTNKQE